MERAININPSILTWARETAGLSIEDAAKKLGLTDTQRSTAADKLRELEAGERNPTRNQLAKIASVYRRPLTVFYRHTPPQKGDRGEDFRTLPEDVSGSESARLDMLLRDVRARQDMVRALLEEDPDLPEIDFIGSMSIEENIASSAARLRAHLGFAHPGETAARRDAEDLFNTLRQRTEQTGVFVLLMGNLGSHHSAISETVFRGFAIADKLAPFIVINDQDAKPAWSFTLIHELTHLFVGSTGVSGAPSTIDPDTPAGRVERFCNDVASEFLLPAAEIPETEGFATKAEAVAFIERVAQQWNVSEPMVAYRMRRIGKLDLARYRELAADYRARWHAQKRRTQNRETGPSYYTVRRHRLGNALLGLVRRNLKDNELTHTKAAKMLGVKPGNVEPILSNVNYL